MTLTVATALDATSGRLLQRGHEGVVESRLDVADLTAELSSVSIDSREVSAGALFVALKGEKTDGHAFVGTAFSAGARACLVSTEHDSAELRSRLFQAGTGCYLLAVPDPLLALQALAAAWRKQYHTPVIAVTGSVGKTTTREIVASVLGSKFSVLKSQGNFNTEIGLPLTLLELSDRHQVAVLEMGMYGPGEIATLARIAQPQIAIVTNVQPVHLERMGTIAKIARAKSELPASLPAEGLAILNADDPWTRAMAVSSTIGQTAFIGISREADFRADSVKSQGLNGFSFTLRAEGETLPLEIPVPGPHLVHGFLAAAAAGRYLGMEWSELRAAIEQVRVDVRQRLVPVEDDLLLIDDCYNASPPSMHAALEVLAGSAGTKIAVLGDMLELGPIEEQAHREVGEHAAEVADWLIVRGTKAEWIAQGAIEGGIEPLHIRRSKTNLEAANQVRSILDANGRMRPGRTARQALDDMGEKPVVLVKGSRSMRMEEIVDALQNAGRPT